MTRIYTVGHELEPVADDSFATFEGDYTVGTGTSITRDTTVKRSGNASRGHVRGGTSALVYTGLQWGLLGLNGYYARIHFQVSNLPAGTVRLMFLATGGAGSPLVGARLTAGGKIQLFNETGTPAQIGSDSTATIATSTWYRLELYGKTGSGAVDETELRLDGVSVASATGQSYSDSQIQAVFYGWLTSPGGAYTVWTDDVAVNDDTGATNNSWPGNGQVIYLSAVSDNARGANWTAGAGATTNLFEAVNNSPPSGVAAGSATDTSQIKNTNTADTTGNYDANMSSYTAAGLGSNDSVTLVQAVLQTGSSAATGVSGAIQIVSNPAQGSEESKTFGPGSAIGTYGTNWQSHWGAAQNSPSVTVGDQPVLRIGRRGTQAAECHCCGMWITVEYVPGTAPESPLRQGRSPLIWRT